MQDNTPHIAITIARKAPPPRLDAVHIFDPCRKAQVLYGLRNQGNGFLNTGFIRIAANHRCRVLREKNIPRGSDTHSLFSIYTHVLRVQVHGASLRLHDLVF